MHIYTHKVQYYETDKMGITHHSNYIRWMEESRVSYLASIGLDYSTLEKRGVISPVIGISCRYKKPTYFNDDIDIEVSIKEYSGIKLIFNYTMKNKNNETVLTGESEHCFISDKGHIIIPKSVYPDIDEIIVKNINK